MARYAAVDIGSNSIRMLAAETNSSGGVQQLAAERQVVRLGESVFRSGVISAEAIAETCAVLRRMALNYKTLGVSGVRAVATSAVREAGNQREFLELAATAIGAPVEIISGQEEARLIHLGVESQWPHPGQRILIVDVGGGSAEFILAENSIRKCAYSKPLGAVRLQTIFLDTDPPDTVDLRCMLQYIDEKMAPAVANIAGDPFGRMIVTAASAAALVSGVHRIPRSRREDADRLRATLPQVRKFYREMSTKTLAGRRRTPGIGPRRAEIIVPGVAVFLRTMEAFGVGSLYYCAAGVREGIVADLAARGVGRELSRLDRDRRRGVEQMARRFGVSVPHARKVAGLAHGLFDGLTAMHGLPHCYGGLLEAAAYLHDTGHYVSD